jgi:hypothetical protein
MVQSPQCCMCVTVHDTEASQVVIAADQLPAADLGWSYAPPSPSDDACITVHAQQASLACWAALAVTSAQLAGCPVPPYASNVEGCSTVHLGSEPDQQGVQPTLRVGTCLVGREFFTFAYTSGITLYEPFGGLCAGLEMVLRNGWTVARYLYSDIDAAARAAACHRVQWLTSRYPSQLQPDGLVDMFTALPHDVKHAAT